MATQHGELLVVTLRQAIAVKALVRRWLFSYIAEQVKQRHEGRTGDDVSFVDEGPNVVDRYPLNFVAFEGVFRRADVGCRVGAEDVVFGGHQAGRWLAVDQRTYGGSGSPAGFFFGFASGGVGGFFTWLDAAVGDFPAVGVGDEPVPPDEQHPSLVDHDDAGARGCGADDAVVQVASTRQLDVGCGDVDPLVAIEVAFAVDGPAHQVPF